MDTIECPFSADPVENVIAAAMFNDWRRTDDVLLNQVYDFFQMECSSMSTIACVDGR